MEMLKHLVDYGLWEIAITLLVFLEWRSSRTLDKKLGSIMNKYVKRLEDTHYEMVKKLIRKRKNRSKERLKDG